MKKISCEMCGGNNFIKEDGFFVCQNCGVKYSVAEAQKILLEGKVDVTGSQIKIDDSEELKNLYILANRAKDCFDCQNAVNYYNQILLKRPNDWEVCFYHKFFSVADCKASDVIFASQKIKDACYFVFSAWKENEMTQEQKNLACHEITKYILKFSQNSFGKVMNEFSQTNGNHKSSAWENPYELPDNSNLQNTEYCFEQCREISDLLYILGDLIESNFTDKSCINDAVELWKYGLNLIKMRNQIVCNLHSGYMDERKEQIYEAKVQKYEMKHIFAMIKNFFKK